VRYTQSKTWCDKHKEPTYYCGCIFWEEEMPVPDGVITTTDIMNNLVPEPYAVLNAVLWDNWKETLPNSPGDMATIMLEEFKARGWKLVKSE
jgi:hypothetical protein